MRAQTAAQQLRLAVSAGEFTPGQKLSEVAVAQRFGISRDTLRESYAMLIADGVLERVPNRGVFIAYPTAEDILSLFRARAVVEPGAVLWGSGLDVDALDRIVTEAESAESVESAEIALANQEFHRTLVAAAGSGVLDEEMDRLLARMRLVFLTVERVRPNLHEDFVAVNRQIVTLLQADDRAGAASVLRTSLVETGESLAATVPE